MVLLNAVQSVLSIMIMIGIGYVLTHKQWFDAQTSSLFSRLIIYVTLPAMMLANLVNFFDRDQFMMMGAGFFVPLTAIFAAYGLAQLSSRVFRFPEEKKGVYSCLFALSNTIFVGLPVNVALFGEESIPYALIYYVANTLIFWTMGVYGIRRDVRETNGLTLQMFRNVLTPPLIAFFLSALLVVMAVPLPRVIMDTSSTVGRMTTPLSLFFVGIVMYSMPLSRFRMNRLLVGVLIGRYLITPALVLFIMSFFSFPPLMRNVFVVQAAMPVMTQSVIVAQTYGADDQFAALGAVVTTLASLVVIPAYVIILG